MEQISQHVEAMSFEQLASTLILIDEQTRQTAVNAVNKMATLRNWLHGAYIVEYEQYGCDRAKYGDKLIERLAERMKDKRINSTLLKLSRKLYLTYPNVIDEVIKSATVSHFLPEPSNVSHCVDLISAEYQKSATLSHQFITPSHTLIERLSFSHLRELMTIDDPMIRFFYETECIRGTWSVRELRRQISTNLHVRVGLSDNKDEAMLMVNQSAEHDSIANQIRQPYSFEFLGLEGKDVISEKNLEDALIDHLQEFMLELGTGFCFEARQKRIIIDDRYYYADLVFYNRLLHCSVILELKNDEFRHEHIGQLNAYVSYYAENEMHPGDNPPVGILLCTRKGQKMVEYALGSLDNQLFVSTYQLQLPNKETLEEFIKKECQTELKPI